jgi:hypothetical protein
MMRIKIKDENKMRKFINSNIEENINDEDFQDWIDYLQEYADFINDVENEDSKFNRVRQTANLTLIIDENDYEVEVNFDKIVDNEGIYFEVDMDYKYFEEI